MTTRPLDTASKKKKETELSVEDTGLLQAEDLIPVAEPHREAVMDPSSPRPAKRLKSNFDQTLALGRGWRGNPKEVRKAARSSLYGGYFWVFLNYLVNVFHTQNFPSSKSENDISHKAPCTVPCSARVSTFFQSGPPEKHCPPN